MGLKQVKMAAILNFRGQIMKLTTEMDSMGVKYPELRYYMKLYDLCVKS